MIFCSQAFQQYIKCLKLSRVLYNNNNKKEEDESVDVQSNKEGKETIRSSEE